jgi:hypothetical protein
MTKHIAEEYLSSQTTDVEKQLMLRDIKKSLNIIKDLQTVYFEAMKLDRQEAINAIENLYYEALMLPIHAKADLTEEQTNE